MLTSQRALFAFSLIFIHIFIPYLLSDKVCPTSTVATDWSCSALARGTKRALAVLERARRFTIVNTGRVIPSALKLNNSTFSIKARHLAYKSRVEVYRSTTVLVSCGSRFFNGSRSPSQKNSSGICPSIDSYPAWLEAPR